MLTISSTDHLPDHLAVFIRETCPWMDDGWEPDSIGYLFVLDDDDIGTTTINPIPKENYLVIDFATFDLWEEPTIQDPVTGYWNVVAILGQEFGCTVFMSDAFVESIPELKRRLEEMRQ